MRISKQERVELESILHPAPQIEGCDILHEHRPHGIIRFSLWRGDKSVNPFYVDFHRSEILLCSTSFFNDYWQAFECLLND